MQYCQFLRLGQASLMFQYVLQYGLFINDALQEQNAYGVKWRS